MFCEGTFTHSGTLTYNGFTHTHTYIHPQAQGRRNTHTERSSASTTQHHKLGFTCQHPAIQFAYHNKGKESEGTVYG